LDRGFGTNLGAEFEAIRYRFGRTVDAKFHPIEGMYLDTKVKGRLREVGNASGGKVDLGSPGASLVENYVLSKEVNDGWKRQQ
jgi:hypothetical protein